MELLQELIAALSLGKEPAFLLAGTLGMAAHYFKKRMRGEVLNGFTDYFIRDYPGRSMGAAFAFALAAAGLLATGAIDAMSAWAAAGCGFTTGWTCNSALNKGNE